MSTESFGPFHAYIMASLSRRIYTGVTSDLPGRVYKHKHHFYPNAHTARYRIDRLVYHEAFDDIRAAIAREKQIKGWGRERRVRLIESMNPGWHDLGLDLLPGDAP
jgi:putative endonuclease